MTTTLSTAGQTGTESSRRHLGVALFVIATAQLMIVLDATIVYVALPHIQAALGFSGSGLEWVANAYALTFGGLLLLGGRAGDLLGRRRMFIIGLLLFSAASLAGGFATSPAWLLAARAVQGAGGAIVAPTALALIATTFPEGPPRSRAMGVYAAMSVAGSSVGLLAGGLLVAYADWRWVLFVNVPIGIAVAVTARFVLAPGTARRPGSGGFDLPGTITGTAGVAALVYGLSNAATSPNGTSHWGDARVVVALAASAVLLAAFAVIESRSRHALLPVRLLRNRDRVGAYLMMLGVGTLIAGVFFFLTLFVQDVWGYSALRTGVAFLPVTAAMLVGAVGGTALVPRIGARPVLVAGSAVTVGGLYWLSRMTEHGTLRGRPDRRGPGPRHRVRPADRAAAAAGPDPRPPRRTPARPPACSTPDGRWAARSGWRCWGRWPGRWWRTTHAVTRWRHGAPPAPSLRRCTGMRWWSASTVRSWSAPGSRC